MTTHTVERTIERKRDPGIIPRLASMNTLWITVALFAEIAVFAAWLPSGTFLSLFNIQTILGDLSVVLMMATAATLVILTGGIDLSLGSVLTLAGVCNARLMSAIAPSSEGLAVVAGTLGGLGVGVICGSFNGYLIAYRKIPAFVVTLGMLSVALGIARLASGGVGISGAPAAVRVIGQGYILGVPIAFLIALALVLFFSFIAEKTRFGEHTYFIGSSPEASTRGGINVPFHTMLIYIIASTLAGAAGVVDFARFEVASVSTGHTTELIAAIAAVVIGGGSLFGGVGSLRGTAVGVFIPVFLANGLLIGGIERFWQDVITGFILILAVGFDQWRRQAETQR